MSEDAINARLDALEERIDSVGERLHMQSKRITNNVADIEALEGFAKGVSVEAIMVRRDLTVIQNYENMLKSVTDFTRLLAQETAEYTRAPLSDRVKAAQEGAEASIAELQRVVSELSSLDPSDFDVE